MGKDTEPGNLHHLVFQILHRRYLYIIDILAGVAYEVIVRMAYGVKPAKAGTEIQLPNLAFLLEDA